MGFVESFAGPGHRLAEGALMTTPFAPPLAEPRLLVFDSGIGGLSVLREIVAERPDARITYVADDAGFPYGGWDEPALVARILALMDDLVAEHRPDLVVIACNTASTLVLGPLRARFALPFVGTVPAIKPAAERTRSGLVSVLATPGTVRRDYTHGLVEAYAAHVKVTLVGSPHLATLAEATMRGEAVPDALILREAAPCFVEEAGARTDTVVLACTHYPFLRDALARVAPWPVDWIDPAPAIARRVVQLVGPRQGDAAPGRRHAVFTTGRAQPDGIRRLAGGLGLET